jgi:hypothetical protein
MKEECNKCVYFYITDDGYSICTLFNIDVDYQDSCEEYSSCEDLEE